MNVPRGTQAKVLVGCLLEDESLSFQTPIDQKSLDVYSFTSDEYVDTEVYGGMVKWTLDLDARSWGLKDLVPHITGFWAEGAHEIEGGPSVPFMVRYPESEPPVEEPLTPEDVLVSSTGGWRVEVSWEGGTGVRITEVTLDFTNKLFTAIFK